MRNTSSAWYEQWYHMVPSGSVYPTSFHAAYLDLDLPDPTNWWYQDGFLRDGDLNLKVALADVIWDIYKDSLSEELTFDSFIKAYPSDQQINLPTYLKDLTTNLTGWMGARTTHASKTFTALSSTFSGSETVTRDDAMALYLGNFMSMSADKQQRLMECIKGMEESLGVDTSSLSAIKNTINDLLPHYRNAFGWRSASDSQKASTITYAWNLLEGCVSDSGETIRMVLGESLYSEVKKAFPVALDFALTLANEDYYQNYSSQSVSSSKHLYMIATIIYNAMHDDLSIVSAHYPEEYITALQMDDDFYTDYLIAVDGLLQPQQAGDIQQVWFASYDENGQMVTVQGTGVAGLPYDSIAKMDSGSGKTWNLFYANGSSAPVTAASSGTAQKAG